MDRLGNPVVLGSEVIQSLCLLFIVFIPIQSYLSICFRF